MEKPIWFVTPPLEELNRRSKGNMVETLGIVFTEVGPNSLTARMPVDARTKQPHGLLHGGASAALAETLASSAGSLVVDPEAFICVGVEINANHLRPCKEGHVEGVARPIHLGRTTQVWDIQISQDGKLVCVSRMTAAVLPRPKQG